MKKQGVWFKNSFRRSLVDMHISDAHESFLKEFSPEAYVDYLKSANIDSAMIYLQSHAGLCHYPTKSGEIHKNLIGNEDVIRRTIDLIHKNGMYAVGYYSLIFNTREEDKHPEWRMIDDVKSGTSPHQRGGRYGFLCPNNLEHRAFVKTQLSEIAEYFELDGLFLDMTFWPAVCRCECCRQRFSEEYGYDELPEYRDYSSPASQAFGEARYKWMTDFGTDITAHAKKVMPGVSISHNNASAVARGGDRGVDETIGELCDYVTGDLYGSLLGHSFSMKYYRGVSKNQPFEYMLTRFSQNLSQHTLSKTPRQLKQGVLMTAAHHGANFVIDAIDPVGTLDPNVAKLIGEAYAEEKKYEKYIGFGEPVSDVAVWYSTKGRYSSHSQRLDSLTASTNIGETLGSNHVLYDVIANTGMDKLSKYPIVFAPAIAGIGVNEEKAIKNYVANGGVFVFSGLEVPLLVRDFFGSVCEGFTPVQNTYVSPTENGNDILSPFSEKYPLSLSDYAPIMTAPNQSVRVLGTLTMPYIDENDKSKFAAIHSNPPVFPSSHPMIMEADYGLGKVLWLGVSHEGYEGRQYRKIVMNIINRYVDVSSFDFFAEAPGMIEAVAYSDGVNWQISFSNVGDAEDGRIISPFNVRIKTDKVPKRVILLPEEKDIPFENKEGAVIFKTEEMDLFAMYSVEF